MALIIFLSVIAAFNLIGICWYVMVTSEGFQKILRKTAQFGDSLKRASKSYKGEPQGGTIEYAINYYGFTERKEYYAEKKANRDAIQKWVNGLRARGFKVSWSFVDVYIDKISIEYDGKMYQSDIDFKHNLDGTKTVLACIACNDKEAITIEGAKDIRPEFNLKAALETDESFKYLQSVKENVLRNGEAELIVSELLGFDNFEELSNELSIKQMDEVYKFIENEFYTSNYDGEGQYTVYGLKEELE